MAGAFAGYGTSTSFPFAAELSSRDPRQLAVAVYRIVGGKLTTFTTVVVPDALVGSD